MPPRNRHVLCAVLTALWLLASCVTPDARAPLAPAELDAMSSVVSRDILARAPVTETASVRHILIGWRDLSRADDPRAQERTQAEAEALVQSLMTQLSAGESFLALMKSHSEDPGSVSGRAYDVNENAGFVIAFQQLAYRLQLGETGVCQTRFGLHIMRRIK